MPRTEDLRAEAKANAGQWLGKPYLGRGLGIGKLSNEVDVAFYFVTGRSGGSQNREFTEDRGVISTMPHDLARSSGETSLTIYNAIRPVRTADGWALVVSNGNHTDAIANQMASGGTFMEAMDRQTYEPDPYKTPRIAGVIHPEGPDKYQLAIVGESEAVADQKEMRPYLYRPRDLRNGLVVAISTYEGSNVEPVASFRDYPKWLEVAHRPVNAVFDLREQLNGEYFVAAAVVTLDRFSNTFNYAIVDRWETEKQGSRRLG